MELREYWSILARRWRLIALISAISFGFSLLTLAIGPETYKSEMRLTVSVKPEPRVGEYYTFDRYYSWLTAEYLVDDFGEVIKSDAFARDVAKRLGKETLPAGAIKRYIDTDKTHRLLTIEVRAGTAAESQEIADAIKGTLEAQAPDYFVQLNSEEAVLRVIDEPRAQPEMGSARKALELILRTMVGLLLGMVLAFLLHYLDPTVRNASEAERLTGLNLLAEIPEPAKGA